MTWLGHRSRRHVAYLSRPVREVFTVSMGQFLFADLIEHHQRRTPTRRADVEVIYMVLQR